MKKLLLLGMTLLSWNLSWAGQDRGGGDVIVCKSRLLGLEKVYLADTYDILKTGYLSQLRKLGRGKAMELALETLEFSNPGAGKKIEKVIKSLDFDHVASVEELDDDNIQLNEPRCEKRQLAVQDVSSNKVRVDQSLYNKLSYAEQDFFKIHEAYIHMHEAPSDTTPIRELVKKIALAQDFDTYIKDSFSFDKLGLEGFDRAIIKRMVLQDEARVYHSSEKLCTVVISYKTKEMLVSYSLGPVSLMTNQRILQDNDGSKISIAEQPVLLGGAVEYKLRDNNDSAFLAVRSKKRNKSESEKLLYTCKDLVRLNLL